MSILQQLGTGLTVGATVAITLPNATNYTVISATENGKQVDMQDEYDSSGALMTRLIFNRFAVVECELICKTAAAPTTDFPEGTVIQISASYWYIDSAKVSRVKGANKVALKMTNINLAPVS